MILLPRPAWRAALRRQLELVRHTSADELRALRRQSEDWSGQASRAAAASAAEADHLRERRWVIYKGEVEASRVPAEWHAWLHHTTDEIPPEGGPPKQPWQKEHERNLTGSAEAYRPPGHMLKGGRRDKATGDYEPWTPS